MKDEKDDTSDSDVIDGVAELEEYKSRLLASIERKEKSVEIAEDDIDPKRKTFKDLGVCPELCLACKQLGWKYPTKIQIEAIPPALEGRDIIGLAETGSGKTAAFTIPILQSLLNDPRRMFCLVLAPTRELCAQTTEQFRALGASIALDVCIILGGLDMVSQALQLAKKPHVIVSSPGRLADHLENTKGFSISTIKFLVLDEADRILSMDFDEALEKIIQALPKERRTFLFSATMTSKVSKLQKVSLVKPVKVSVSTKYSTSELLVQNYMLVPLKFKWTYLASLLWHYESLAVMIFCNTCVCAQKCAVYLSNLDFKAICLHGKMSQMQRLGALNKFKSGKSSVLVTTEVGSRGLDISSVDLVVNFEVPQSSKDYIHRVGRTARAGRSGRAITLVTQYDIEPFQRIEFALGYKLEELKELSEDKALARHEKCSDALRGAELEIKDAPNFMKKSGKFASKYNAAKRKRTR